MKKIKIVADSSSDILKISGIDYAYASLKILTDEKEFTDNADLDTPEMVSYMEQYKGRSKTSCPSAGDWLTAFGDADDVICVTITSGLSGSHRTVGYTGVSFAACDLSFHVGQRRYALYGASASQRV